MRYADCPTVEVMIDIAATPAAVWQLVTDIELSSRFSTEAGGADWVDDHHNNARPTLGARFAGHSSHDAIGTWTTTCTVTGFEVDRLFEWSVTGIDDNVSSIWRYSIEDLSELDDLNDGKMRLRYWFQMGPGRGGLNAAIDRMPDKEERIVARRLAEHEVNMTRMVAGIKELAESGHGAS